MSIKAKSVLGTLNSAINGANGYVKNAAPTLNSMKKTHAASKPSAKDYISGAARKDASAISSTLREKRTGLEELAETMEDRRHDWLARQLREEARIMRTGDFLDLGASHSVHCEADEIKQTHHKLHMKGKNYG